MSTRRKFETDTIRKDNKLLSPLKTLVETAFYKNDITKVNSLEEAYNYARKSPTTIVLDQTVENAEELGLPEDAKLLVENGNSIVGRTARARRIYGKDPEEDEKLLKVVMDAIYKANNYPFLEGEAIVGLEIGR